MKNISVLLSFRPVDEETLLAKEEAEHAQASFFHIHLSSVLHYLKYEIRPCIS